MSFLLFAYRKLFLKRKINDLSFRQIILSQKQQRITEQVGLVQQALSAAKNVVSIFTSGKMNEARNDIMEKYFDPSNGQLRKDINVSEAFVQNELQRTQYAAMMTSQTANSIFEASNQAMLNPLNSEGTQIAQEMASGESQLKLLNAELESVEKAETEAAKQCTPRFGLA